MTPWEPHYDLDADGENDFEEELFAYQMRSSWESAQDDSVYEDDVDEEDEAADDDDALWYNDCLDLAEHSDDCEEDEWLLDDNDDLLMVESEDEDREDWNENLNFSLQTQETVFLQQTQVPLPEAPCPLTPVEKGCDVERIRQTEDVKRPELPRESENTAEVLPPKDETQSQATSSKAEDAIALITPLIIAAGLMIWLDSRGAKLTFGEQIEMFLTTYVAMFLLIAVVIVTIQKHR